jgi:hypothetical protein
VLRHQSRRLIHTLPVELALTEAIHTSGDQWWTQSGASLRERWSESLASGARLAKVLAIRIESNRAIVGRRVEDQ